MHVSALLREEFLNESQVQWDNIEIKRKKIFTLLQQVFVKWIRLSSRVWSGNKQVIQGIYSKGLLLTHPYPASSPRNMYSSKTV